jgi:hypothetical protein
MYYKTPTNYPVKTNCPLPGYVKIFCEEYEQLRDVINAKTAEEQAKLEAEFAPIRERQELIRKRAYENAKRELIAEGIINA